MVDASAIMSPSCSTPLRRSDAIMGRSEGLAVRNYSTAARIAPSTARDRRLTRPAISAPPSHAALATGSLTSSPFFSSLFLAFATGAGLGFLRQLVVLRQLFQLGFEFGPPRGDLFQPICQSRCRASAASSSMLSESRSIFAMPASRFLLATGKARRPQARRRSYPPRTSSARKDFSAYSCNHNPATPLPNSRPNRGRQWTRDRIKRDGHDRTAGQRRPEREEIAARIASFKATQEKFEREREEYFVTTLENARYSENARHASRVRRSGRNRHSGARASANPESRDSGFDASHRPGMTEGRAPGFRCAHPGYDFTFQTAQHRHCERSEAIHFAAKKEWIASSLTPSLVELRRTSRSSQ